MSDSSTIADYSIAAVSKLTGVSCHALRVWERRYQFPVPHRSSSGHRRYSRDQVQVLRRVSELSKAGHTVGDLLVAARDGRIRVDPQRQADSTTVADPAVGELVDRLISGDLVGGEVCYETLSARYSVAETVVHVIVPAMVDAGERWYRHECEIHQDALVTGFLRRKLDVLIDEARRLNTRPSRTIIIGTVEGDRHEGGAMILQLYLELAGWRVLNMGVDIPVVEYQKAVELRRPDALALSFVLSRNINKRFRELARIKDIPVFVGGRSILNYQRLARKNGLIPVAGPITKGVDQLLEAYEVWATTRRVPSTLN
ncbi:MerR family transcriptional regulator [Singulisphaera sp. PoT]|uniref:MerR family transcriptional regulator n=1 Tax=Singulisphaera sp. PoT TaxID=3411797 RepID=UPI003BF4A044